MGFDTVEINLVGFATETENDGMPVPPASIIPFGLTNETENFVYCLANETKNESQSMFVSNIR